MKKHVEKKEEKQQRKPVSVLYVFKHLFTIRVDNRGEKEIQIKTTIINLVIIPFIVGFLLWIINYLSEHGSPFSTNIYFNVMKYSSGIYKSYIDKSQFDVFLDFKKINPNKIIYDGNNYRISVFKYRKHLLGVCCNNEKDILFFNEERDQLQKEFQNHKKYISSKNDSLIYHRVVFKEDSIKKYLFFSSHVNKDLILICEPDWLSSVNINITNRKSMCNKMCQLLQQKLIENQIDNMENFQIEIFPNSWISDVSKRYNMWMPSVIDISSQSDQDYQKSLYYLATKTRSLMVIKPVIIDTSKITFYAGQGYQVFTTIEKFKHDDIFKNLNSFTLYSKNSQSIIDLIHLYVFSIYYYLNENENLAYEFISKFLMESIKNNNRIEITPKDYKKAYVIVSNLHELKNQTIINSSDIEKLSSKFNAIGDSLFFNVDTLPSPSQTNKLNHLFQLEINNQIRTTYEKLQMINYLLTTSRNEILEDPNKKQTLLNVYNDALNNSQITNNPKLQMLINRGLFTLRENDQNSRLSIIQEYCNNYQEDNYVNEIDFIITSIFLFAIFQEI